MAASGAAGKPASTCIESLIEMNPDWIFAVCCLLDRLVNLNPATRAATVSPFTFYFTSHGSELLETWANTGKSIHKLLFHLFSCLFRLLVLSVAHPPTLHMMASSPSSLHLRMCWSGTLKQVKWCVPQNAIRLGCALTLQRWLCGTKLDIVQRSLASNGHPKEASLQLATRMALSGFGT